MNKKPFRVFVDRSIERPLFRVERRGSGKI